MSTSYSFKSKYIKKKKKKPEQNWKKNQEKVMKLMSKINEVEKPKTPEQFKTMETDQEVL